MKRINEFIAAIQNGLAAKKPIILVHRNTFLMNVLQVLKDNGYVGDFVVTDDNRHIRLELKYYHGKPSIRKIKNLTKDRNTAVFKADTRFGSNYDLAIVSTSMGVMSHMEARDKRIGGMAIMRVF